MQNHNINVKTIISRFESIDGWFLVLGYLTLGAAQVEKRGLEA
jgi:hypothetical protein